MGIIDIVELQLVQGIFEIAGSGVTQPELEGVHPPPDRQLDAGGIADRPFGFYLRNESICLLRVSELLGDLTTRECYFVVIGTFFVDAINQLEGLFRLPFVGRDLRFSQQHCAFIRQADALRVTD